MPESLELAAEQINRSSLACLTWDRRANSITIYASRDSNFDAVTDDAATDAAKGSRADAISTVPDETHLWRTFYEDSTGSFGFPNLVLLIPQIAECEDRLAVHQVFHLLESRDS